MAALSQGLCPRVVLAPSSLSSSRAVVAPRARALDPGPAPFPRHSRCCRGPRCEARSSAARTPVYQDNAYFSDEEVSDVEAVLFQDSSANTWLDANYLSLSFTCYRLIRQQTQAALQHHFQRQQKHQHQTTLHKAGAKAAAGMHGTVLPAHAPGASPAHHHACCAPGRDHTFLCGEDAAVALAVAPASVKSGDHFIGTP